MPRRPRPWRRFSSSPFASPARADIAIGGPPPETFSGAALFNATSQDGRRVVFSSRRRLARGDRDRLLDVYLREGGRITLLSPSPVGRTESEAVRFVAATPDARTVLLRTDGRLTAADEDSLPDLYRQGPAGLELISIGSPGEKASGNELRFGTLAANGRRVFFVSEEQLLGGDDDDRRDVYEHRAGRLRLVSTGTAGSVRLHAVAADGGRVVVSTNAALDADDVDGFTDIYSYGPEGAVLISAGGMRSCPAFAPERRQCEVHFAAASSDATRVYFETDDRLSPLDTDSSTDVYRGGTRGSELVPPAPATRTPPRRSWARSQPTAGAPSSSAAPSSRLAGTPTVPFTNAPASAPRLSPRFAASRPRRPAAERTKSRSRKTRAPSSSPSAGATIKADTSTVASAGVLRSSPPRVRPPPRSSVPSSNTSPPTDPGSPS